MPEFGPAAISQGGGRRRGAGKRDPLTDPEHWRALKARHKRDLARAEHGIRR
jgi:hypothetical protein